MEFSETCQLVNGHLDKLILADKVNLLKELFSYPISAKDGKYYYSNMEWDETRMSDFIKINIHWFNVQEFDRLLVYFEKNKPNQSVQS
jgi:hypothetical protein